MNLHHPGHVSFWVTTYKKMNVEYLTCDAGNDKRAMVTPTVFIVYFLLFPAGNI